MMNSNPGKTGRIIAVLFMLTAAASGTEPALRETLFQSVDEALKAANEARAAVFAPKSYGEAAKYYRSAEDKLERARSIDSIQDDLAEAEKAFRAAVESTALAKLTLTNAIQAREDCEEADADTYAPEEWRMAEERFASAAGRLEEGKINSARSRAEEAEELYRSAELVAIKANYLDETRRLLEEAKDDRAKRYAPKTMEKAEALLKQAEKALNQNRYDTDEPRSLARQAKYEVKHAMYLARTLKPVQEKKMTPEDYALSTEEPVTRIAAALDFVAELDEGSEAPTREIINRIEALQMDAYELIERRGQVALLSEEIQRLEGELGIQSERLAAQEEQRRQFRQVEAMFGPGEAQVFTQGQNILIRPVGLVFPTGSAQIETQYFGLLRKLQDAIRLFPNSSIVVEGHTDSFGGDEANLALSQSRAEAVREYLLANMEELLPSSVESVGYGESRPVANNETDAGRAKNRRIDLVIRPRAVAPSAFTN